jgi:hypothetical protein
MTNRREFLAGATCLGVAVAATLVAADGGSEVSPPREKDFDDALFREMELTDEQVDSYYRKALESFLFG